MKETMKNNLVGDSIHTGLARVIDDVKMGKECSHNTPFRDEDDATDLLILVKNDVLLIISYLMLLSSPLFSDKRAVCMGTRTLRWNVTCYAIWTKVKSTKRYPRVRSPHFQHVYRGLLARHGIQCFIKCYESRAAEFVSQSRSPGG